MDRAAKIVVVLLVIAASAFFIFSKISGWHKNKLETAIQQQEELARSKTDKLEQKIAELEQELSDVKGQKIPAEKLDEVFGSEDEPAGEIAADLRVPAQNKSQDLYVSEALKTGRIMAKDEDVCLHCGLCAERCPTGAWDMQKFFYAEAQASPSTLAHHSAYIR